MSLFLVEKERCYGHDFVLRQPHGGLMRGTADATLGYRGMHSFTMHYENYFVPLQTTWLVKPKGCIAGFTFR